MARERTDTFTAEVTIGDATPQAELFGHETVGHARGVVMSCRVRARLRAPSQFDVTETDWIERSFLQSDTATWSWFVTPHRSGSYKLVLQLRPIVTAQEVEEDGTIGRTVHVQDAASGDSAEASAIKEYFSTVDVHVPAAEKSKDVMKALTDFLKTVQGLIVAMTVLVTSIVGLKTALGIRRRKRAGPAS